MLTQLSIRNIVLIESCDLTLERGLCVLTGETGAGKSILLDALGLVLGARADAGLIRQGESQGSVSAEFNIAENAGAKRILTELELDESDTLIIRRSISADGKTRCVINDQSVTVTALKKLGDYLIEVHGQHDQRSLQDSSLQRDMLDLFADHGKMRKAVSAAYGLWKNARNALEQLRADIAQVAREQDYLRHISQELKQLAPKAGEEDELTGKRTLMMQSEKLYELLNEAIGELNGGKGVAASLRSAQRLLTRSPLTQTPTFAAAIESLEKAAIEAEEAQYALEKIGQDATFNPEELERIEERLFELKAAGRKYNLPVDELAALREQTEEKLALIQSQEHRLGALEKEEKTSKDAFCTQAELLSAARKKASVKLEKAIASELAPLKMENTAFRVRIERLPDTQWSDAGMDGVYFECATNVAKGSKDIPYAALSKIASGGELSRFMLALKVALADTHQASTLIFDEIDTGTGGAVADAIGQRLARLGENAQVLVVTHLPQVAARGSQHLQVSKAMQGKKITTAVKALSRKEREEELARMLAGATITPEARKAAQKLLEQAA
ncbi:MAG: DNA repair protein RecN [Rickettsiales bacterium]|nr:DNA repair protein RecN [Rickettsiales bacterium]